MVSDAGADGGRSVAQPEERKTETTLTTRIRINIPGSRPIPPVVVRKPVAEAEVTDEDTGPEAPTAGATSSAGVVEAPAEPAASAEEKTSDWFAPRKSGAPKGSQGSGFANGAGTPTGSAAASGTPTGAKPGTGRPGGVVGSMSVPGGSRPGTQNGTRPGGTNGAGLPGATGGPVAPGHGGGTGSFDVTEALAAGPLGGTVNANGSGDARRDDLPYFSDNGRGGQNGYAGPVGQGGSGGPIGFNGPGGAGGQSGPQGPSGPTGGPVTGDGPLVPPVGGEPFGGVGGAGGPGGAGSSGGPGGAEAFAGPGRPGRPGGPGGGPGAPGGAPGSAGAGRAPGGGLSDDTAILTPQKPAPESASGGYGVVHDNVSGHTVTSGIPVVPPGAQGTPYGSGGRTDGPLPHTPPKLPEPVAQNVPKAEPRKKKGRNKLVLLGGVVVFLGAGAYGAGLLMNHSDVPKGTTVLGVDIGGGTRDEAVKKLDDAFGKRVEQPLKLSVDGDTVTLKPDQAGLQFDEQATVAAAAQSDYNPVSVIGTLFGNHRVVEPVMPVDEEKLAAALEEAAGDSGSATEGTIRFESGKAVAVYGKAGKGIDAAQSKAAVVEAYRTQVETGTAATVKVPTTTKQPTISNAEVDRMMKEFAEPAMSAKVTVMTDAAHSVAFSPKNSLWKFLEVKAVDGKLVESYNEKALEELYGGTFDDVLITRGTGQKTPVTVQDVISALRPALKSTTNRVAVIETNPS